MIRGNRFRIAEPGKKCVGIPGVDGKVVECEGRNGRGGAREVSVGDNMMRNRVRIEDGERVRRGILSTTVKRQMKEMKVGTRISNIYIFFYSPRKRRKGFGNFSDVLSSTMGNMQVYCRMHAGKIIRKDFLPISIHTGFALY